MNSIKIKLLTTMRGSLRYVEQGLSSFEMHHGKIRHTSDVYLYLPTRTFFGTNPFHMKYTVSFFCIANCAEFIIFHSKYLHIFNIFL